MGSIDDQAGISAEQLADKIDPEAVESVDALTPAGGWSLPSWLFIKRLEEPVEKYIQHPLNFGKSEGWAYMIRGFAALGKGVLDYWWMDVVGGLLRLRKESVTKVVQEGGETV